MRLNTSSKIFMILTGVIILSACVTVNYGTPVDSSFISVEHQRTHIASIGNVAIYKQKDGYIISGGGHA